MNTMTAELSMNTMTAELSTIAVRTRRMLYVSAGVHALLLLWLLVHHTVVAPEEGLTEISWVEVPPPVPAAPPVAPKKTKTAPAQEVAVVPSRPEPVRPKPRELKRATLTRASKVTTTSDDAISNRLTSLQRDSKETETSISQMVPPPRVGTPSLAGVAPDAPQAAPSNMQREDTPRAAPTTLSRAPERAVQTAAVVPTAVPEVDSPSAATLENSSAHRELAGAQLAGPVADRKLLSHTSPVYPDWAKSEAVEASVTLYFLVLPDGRVKENVLVDKTSGFGDFDDNAVAALLTWRFEAISSTREQWGKITFNFRLTD